MSGLCPGLSGAHSQRESLDELRANVQEVLAMLLEDGGAGIQQRVRGSSEVRRLIACSARFPELLIQGVGQCSKSRRLRSGQFLQVLQSPSNGRQALKMRNVEPRPVRLRSHK